VDWYERMRGANEWLPPGDRVLDAEVRCDPYRAVMDLRVVVVMPPAPRPAWGGSLPAVPASEANLTASALVHMASAMDSRGDRCRRALREAGARVRAMAREWAVWESAAEIPEGRREGMMRQVVRDILAAAAYWESDRFQLADNHLRSADSILHGLWLAEERG
jgi:hypothetical protein